jgi:tetratricopeptide (TPR) repeat protein
MRLLLKEQMSFDSHTPSASAPALHEGGRRPIDERTRLAAADALVLRVVENRSGEGCPDGFLFLRAAREVEGLEGARDRALLARLLACVSDAAPAEILVARLVEYAYALEVRRRLDEARLALDLARALSPGDSVVALHAGRVARLQGDQDAAMELYRIARGLDPAGPLARLAAVGEASVSSDPLAALGRVVREALGTGDGEAAAVGLEERARLRRLAGDLQGAARDLWVAAVRFPDGADRARVAHRLADLALASCDLHVARQAMLAALDCGDTPQREHARSRLHSLSRDLGDQVGMRRWRSFKRPTLVSLSASPQRARRPLAVGPRMARWREALRTA